MMTTSEEEIGMSTEKKVNGPRDVYSALIGGLMAAFVAIALFTVFEDPNGTSTWMQLATVLTGIACAAGFMTVGVVYSDRIPWLGSGFLFASGFTALWSVVMSFGAGQKWAVLLALAGAIAIGVRLGVWRYGRSSEDQAGMRPSPTIPTMSSTSTTIESSPILK
jgi:hypothetical protein